MSIIVCKSFYANCYSLKNYKFTVSFVRYYYWLYFEQYYNNFNTMLRVADRIACILRLANVNAISYLHAQLTNINFRSRFQNITSKQFAI